MTAGVADAWADAWWEREETWTVTFPTDAEIKAGLPLRTIFAHKTFVFAVVGDRAVTVIGRWEDGRALRFTREQVDELRARAAAMMRLGERKEV